MKILSVIIISFLSVFLVACENEAPVVETAEVLEQEVKKVDVVAKPAEPQVELSKRAEIDKQIQRIEGKLKTNPTVKGWMLVGDAHMHLKRYKEAAGAFNEAYMLSDLGAEPRKKLKNAMYYVGLEKSDTTQ